MKMYIFKRGDMVLPVWESSVDAAFKRAERLFAVMDLERQMEAREAQ